MYRVVLDLFLKEVKSEIRQQSALAGLALYLFSAVYIAYSSLGLRGFNLDARIWSALFWIIILFSAFGIVGKGFIGERKGILLYYHTLVTPGALLFSKMVYSFLLTLILSIGGWLMFSVLLGNPIQDQGIFLLNLGLSSACFGSTLTMLSAIASKAGNSNVLLAIMGFPVVISILLLSVRLTINTIDGLGMYASNDELLTLLAIHLLTLAASYLLFPYIWRS